MLFFFKKHTCQNQTMLNLREGVSIRSSHQSGSRRGVSVMIADKFNFEVQFEIKDNEGRYVMVGGRLEGIEVTFLNVYAPSGANWSEKKPWARWIHS